MLTSSFRPLARPPSWPQKWLITMHKDWVAPSGLSPLLLLVLLLSGSGAAHAFTYQPTRLEYYLMPPYCQARMSDFYMNRRGAWRIHLPINEDEIDRWKSTIGYDWANLHHYCFGTVLLSKTQMPGKRDKRSFYYKQAVQEIDYTRSRSKVGAPLWDKMTVDYARALEGTGNVQQALAELATLLQRSPEHTPTRLAMAQTLERQGELPKAIKVLEEGLPSASEKGPLLFYLARYYYESGDLLRARQTLELAEQSGMKMDSLREDLGLPPHSANGADASGERMSAADE